MHYLYTILWLVFNIVLNNIALKQCRPCWEETGIARGKPMNIFKVLVDLPTDSHTPNELQGRRLQFLTKF